MITIKAVILAGGTGTRLRPVTLGMPKPMSRVLDVPLIAHNIELLKKHGFNDVFVTLKYLPRMITDYLGDGSRLGVNIEYVYEKEALGTAGGVKKCFERCRDSLLVMSGDAATDCDLTELISFSKERGASVGIAVVSGPDPLEYGSVFVEADGRITRFSEKPSRGAVCGELINTGIYYLTRRVLNAIPEGRCDFAKDVFPALLSEHERLYAWRSECYWLDVGTCEALRRANMDALGGKIYEYRKTDRAGVIEPSFISKKAVVEDGSEIGPYAVIGEGSHIGSGAKIRSSVLCSAKVGRDADISGSILCENSVVGDGASVGPGCVLGEGSEVGAGSCLGGKTALWPGRIIPAGSSISGSDRLQKKYFIEFDAEGRVCGDASSLTADLAFSLGRAAASISARILYASERDSASQAMAACFAAGAASAGAMAALCDSSCAASLAYACYLFSSAGLFVSDASTEPTLTFFGPDGYRLERDAQRRLEASEGSFHLSKTGSITSFTGTDEALISMSKRLGEMPLYAKINGSCPSSRLLSRIAAVSAEPPFVFSISRDGFSLSIADKTGERMSHAELLCALTYSELKSGKKTVILPEDAPFAAFQLADGFGASVLVRGRDRIAPELPDRSRDGFFLASGLAPLLDKASSVAEIKSMIPLFFTAELNFDSGIDAAALLRRAVETESFGECSTGNGLTARYGRGHIRIIPAGGTALRVRAECSEMEAAQELAADAAEILKKLI